MSITAHGRPLTRRLPIGAELQPGGGVHFRVWAPLRKRVEIVFPEPGAHGAPRHGGAQLPSIELDAEPNGYFSGYAPDVGAGTLYAYGLDGSDRVYPDPVSRQQPHGPHGASAVVDPSAYAWRDGAWRGAPLERQVIYEMHIGTFTEAGTWAPPPPKCLIWPTLGVTMLEVMPVAEFAGRFGWGYDGVDFFAPTRLYGTARRLPPFRRCRPSRTVWASCSTWSTTISARSAITWAVLRRLSFRRHTPSGAMPSITTAKMPARCASLSFPTPAYWIDEFHCDGLRLDAMQAIVDDSAESILAAIIRPVRQARRPAQDVGHRRERVPGLPAVASGDEGGYGLDARLERRFSSRRPSRDDRARANTTTAIIKGRRRS